MGDVVSLLAWRDSKKYITINEPCDLPFHVESNILNLWCLRCNVEVVLNAHPTLPEPRWYTKGNS